MSFIVTIVHVCVSLFLMLTVLLQAGKGGGMGATFGGGSSQGSVFGGSGAGDFLSKLTTISATLFMLTSMTLAYLVSTTTADPLRAVSKEARANAAVKQKLSMEAVDSVKPNESPSDAGLVDELPPELKAPPTGDTAFPTNESSESGDSADKPKTAGEPKTAETKTDPETKSSSDSPNSEATAPETAPAKTPAKSNE